MVERKKVNCTVSRRFILKMVGNVDVGRWRWLQQQTTLRDASVRAGAASSGPRMASPEVQDQTVTDKLVSLVLREAAMSAAQRSFQKTRVQDEC